jgi:hypothetical protein
MLHKVEFVLSDHIITKLQVVHKIITWHWSMWIFVVAISLSLSLLLSSLLLLLLLGRHTPRTGMHAVFSPIRYVYLFLNLIFPLFLTVTLITLCANFSLISSVYVPCNKLKVLESFGYIYIYIYWSNISNLSKRYVDCRNYQFCVTDLHESA